ncbi:MAG TPA: hydrolase TatD [Chloroflexi bacterium]|nr:hydrolase TatD [Chloroflexota bacterium]
MLIDTHVHLDFHQFDRDRDAVIGRAAEAGVMQMITIGTDLATSRAAIGLAERYAGVFAAVGVHPNDSAAWDPIETPAELRALAAHPKVVAIGEIGLDYYWERVPHDHQARVFQQQLELAAERDLPVVIHDREAHADLMTILRQWVSDVTPRRRRGVLHFYSGDRAMADEALALGFCLGVDGPITYKNATELQALVAGLPLDRLLLETDAPFLAPQPYRGKRNEPAYVVEVARKVAELQGCSLGTVATQTTRNARALFGLEEAFG